MKEFISIAKSMHTSSNKVAFHRKAKQVLVALAEALALRKGSYDIRSNKAGTAVRGEVILHGEQVYVMLGENPKEFMWRLCKGQTDFSGGTNVHCAWESLLDINGLARKIKSEIEDNKHLLGVKHAVLCAEEDVF